MIQYLVTDKPHCVNFNIRKSLSDLLFKNFSNWTHRTDQSPKRVGTISPTGTSRLDRMFF